MHATHPAARMRPDDDYIPGPPLITDHGIIRIRSAADARMIAAADDAGGVCQNMHYTVAQLRAAGVPGIPADYADVHEIYQFAWAQGDEPLSGPGGEEIPCRHRLLLSHFEDRLTKPVVDAAAPTITGLAATLLDELMPPRGTTLDAAAYSRCLAFRSAAHLAGIPVDDAIETTMFTMFERFTRRPGVAIIPVGDPGERAFLQTLLDTRAPGLIADVMAAHDDKQLTDEEAFGMIRGWLYAGTDTTSGTTATLLGFLASGDGQPWQARARAAHGGDRSKLLVSYVLEAARLQPTFPEMPFITYRQVTLPSGLVIQPNRQVLIVVPAVNRDPELAGPDPEAFRPGRRGSYAFGSGLHACTGKYLALTVASIAVGAVLGRTATLTLPDDGWVSESNMVTSIDRARLAYIASPS